MTARFERTPEEHLMIEETQIKNLFEGMANMITHETIEELTGKSSDEFEFITKVKLKRDLTLSSL